jgi:hypothetical protein
MITANSRCSRNTRFLFEVIHRLQLTLIYASRHGDQNRSEWIQHPGHLVNLSSPHSQDLAIHVNQVFRTIWVLPLFTYTLGLRRPKRN